MAESKLLTEEHDFRAVFKALHVAKTKWWKIGLELKLPKSDLDEIENKVGTNFEQGLREMITLWLKRRSLKPTWESLVKALRDKTIGEEGLAVEIEEKHVKPKLTEDTDAEPQESQSVSEVTEKVTGEGSLVSQTSQVTPQLQDTVDPTPGAKVEVNSNDFEGHYKVRAESAPEVDETPKCSNTSLITHCTNHPTKRLKVYCKTCRELICGDCTIGLHPRPEHMYVLVADTFPKHLEAVSTVLQAMANCQKEIEVQTTKVKADIYKRFEQLQKALEQRKSELVDQLNDITQQKLKRLAAQRDEVKLLQTKLSGCLKYTEDKLEGETLAMVESNTLQPVKQDIAFVEGNASVLTEACFTLGVILDSDPMQCYTTGDGLKSATVGENAEITLHTEGMDALLQPHDVNVDFVCCRKERKINSSAKKVGRGTYQIRYLPKLRGQRQLNITIGGKQTKGSPHSVIVHPRLQTVGQPTKVLYFAAPWGIATDSKGRLVVVEKGKNRVTVMTADGAKQSFGCKGSKHGQFMWPYGVAVDTDDNVYVVDSENDRIQKLTLEGKHIQTVGSQGSDPLQFKGPVGIAVNNAKIYVCDGCNHRVQSLTSSLTFTATFGSKGSEPGQFLYPCGVALDQNGKVFVADTGNDRIQVFTPDGQFLNKFGDQGSSQEKTERPSSITVDGEKVYVTERDSGRVIIYNTDGRFLHSFATKGSAPGQLENPWGITIDSHGYILVADRGNNRVQMF